MTDDKPPATPGFRILLSAQQSAELRQSIAPQAIIPLVRQQEGVTKPEQPKQADTTRRPLHRFLRWTGLTVLLLVIGAPPRLIFLPAAGLLPPLPRSPGP